MNCATRLPRIAVGLVVLVVLFVLSACAAAPGNRPPATEPKPPPDTAVSDRSYDWHELLLVPFGTLLKESSIALHEVLLFNDTSSAGSAGSAAAAPAAGTDAGRLDCFAANSPPARFVGVPLNDYLLCFEHDRLSHIDASVQLSETEGALVFARACALWHHGIGSAPAVGNLCEGGEDRIRYSARLSSAPGETRATLSMTLVPAAIESDDEPDAAGARRE